MSEGIIKDAYEAIIKEIQAIITISYIAAIGIGMLFNHQKYSEFKINIFDYADVFDYLVAPFSDFRILLFSSISIALVLTIIQLDFSWRKKYPESYSKWNFGLDKKEWYSIFRYTTFVVIFIWYLYLSADIYGRFARQTVKNQQAISIHFADNEVKTGKMIGKTNEVIFLLTDENIKAIPITSLVKEIDISNRD